VAAGVPVARVGTTGGVSLTGPHLGAISVEDLTAAHEAFLPALMSGETA
jgi:phosphoribosylformylglycinamidine synthase